MQINIRDYKNIVILTGAGISKASGLNTYRGENGLWENNDISEFGTLDSFLKNPIKTWELYGELRNPIKNAMPNDAHIALADLEKRLNADQNILITTQNVDGLHQKAGSTNVVELHGNINLTSCSVKECSLKPFFDENTYEKICPTCSVCGANLRPSIVLFGEHISAYAEWMTKKKLREADLFIAIGTSGTVSPAANFVRSAEYAGARTIYINISDIENSSFGEKIIGKAEEVLPNLFSF